MSADTACRLYLITPPALPDLKAFVPPLRAALDAGDVAALQIRLKNIDDDAIRRAVDALRPVAQDFGVAVILNDRPDLAVETGCDGVHVGQEDAPYAEARRLVGPDAIVGVTCNDNGNLGIDAADDGADYVGFGAFFPTTTKDTPYIADVDLLKWWQETMTVPCVAIGGITPLNARPLVQAGADFLAVSSAVWAWPDGPGASVKLFNALMANP